MPFIDTAPTSPHVWRARAVQAALFLLPVALIRLGTAWWLAILPWFFLLGYAYSRSQLHLVGPFFYYDLLRMSRRLRTIGLRCGYALLLLSVLSWFYAEKFGQQALFSFTSTTLLDQAGLARFGHDFTLTILTVQHLAILLLTPAYLAGVIAEERERKTLELLFTTHLTDSELILGRLFARLTHLGTVLLTALPILSLTSFWGVHPAILVSAFVVTGLTLLTVGSISILCSVQSQTVLRAELLTYGFILGGSFAAGAFCIATPAAFLLGPAPFVIQLEEYLRETPVSPLRGVPSSPPDIFAASAILLGVFALVHLLVSSICLAIAIGALRGPMAGDPDNFYRRREPMTPAQAERYQRWAAEFERAVRNRPSEPVTEPPLLWKEIRGGTVLRLNGPQFSSAFLPLIALCVLMFLMSAMAHAGIEALYRMVPLVCLVIWYIGLSFQNAGSVARERQQRTLVDLLMLPCDRMEILGAKWLGGIVRLRFVAYGAVTVWVFGFFFRVLEPLGIVLSAISCAVQVVFLASVALWLSVFCHKTLHAKMLIGLVLLLFFVGGLIVRQNMWPRMGYAYLYDFRSALAEVGLNPLGCLWFLGFSPKQFDEWLIKDFQGFKIGMLAALAGQAIFAAVAFLLWKTACWRFRREES